MSILDDLLGRTASRASNAAAQDQYGKQTAAVSGLNNYANTLPAQYGEAAGGLDPYAGAGNSALERLMAGLGLGGQGGQEAFTNAYQGLPGYQEGLDTGTNAALRGANAGGMLNSGRTLKSLYRFGSDYENQRSGDYLNRLTGLASGGQSAAGTQAGIQTQGLGTQAGLRQSAFGGDINSAGTIGQGMVAGANAQQSALTNLLSAGGYLAGSYLGGRPRTA